MNPKTVFIECDKSYRNKEVNPKLADEVRKFFEEYPAPSQHFSTTGIKALTKIASKMRQDHDVSESFVSAAYRYCLEGALRLASERSESRFNSRTMHCHFYIHAGLFAEWMYSKKNDPCWEIARLLNATNARKTASSKRELAFLADQEINKAVSISYTLKPEIARRLLINTHPLIEEALKTEKYDRDHFSRVLLHCASLCERIGELDERYEEWMDEAECFVARHADHERAFGRDVLPGAHLVMGKINTYRAQVTDDSSAKMKWFEAAYHYFISSLKDENKTISHTGLIHAKKVALLRWRAAQDGDIIWLQRALEHELELGYESGPNYFSLSFAADLSYELAGHVEPVKYLRKALDLALLAADNLSAEYGRHSAVTRVNAGKFAKELFEHTGDQNYLEISIVNYRKFTEWFSENPDESLYSLYDTITRLIPNLELLRESKNSRDDRKPHKKAKRRPYKRSESERQWKAELDLL